VAPYGTEPESNGRRRDLITAGVFLVVAFSTLFLSQPTQQTISTGLQVSVLRPFMGVQRRLAAARIRAAQADSMLARIDSLSEMLASHSALVDENRTLRGLLELSERAGPQYLPATVLRPGTPGSESMFIVDVGRRDGIRNNAPVVGPFGLVGVIREVREGDAVGMDWTHPDFRASAMLEDGSAFGLVERDPGDFREEDRLVLNGIPFNLEVVEGAMVVTSGLGGIYPRGIPIGRVGGQNDAEGEWRKSYWLEPVVQPGAATHVLVLTEGASPGVSGLWAPDSIR
jgi:rod shape-determining protein MreC